MHKNNIDDDKYIIKTQEERDAEAKAEKNATFNKMIDDLVLNNLIGDIKEMDDLGATGKMAEAWDIAGATIKKAAGLGYIKGRRIAHTENKKLASMVQGLADMADNAIEDKADNKFINECREFLTELENK